MEGMGKKTHQPVQAIGCQSNSCLGNMRNRSVLWWKNRFGPWSDSVALPTSDVGRAGVLYQTCAELELGGVLLVKQEGIGAARR